MRDVRELSDIIANREVLVLGKGPSLSSSAFLASSGGRCVIGVNQTAQNFPVSIAFFIDIEPFLEISESLLSGDVAVVLPWHPNQRARHRNISRPMKDSLLDLVDTNPVLRLLDEQRRLFYFHTSSGVLGASQVSFAPSLVSLSSLLQILASLNVKVVKTLGVDGGQGYSTELSNSNLKTQLQSGYSAQFPILRKLAIQRELNVEKAEVKDINIYIGCEPAQYLPAKVLEHSILRTTSLPVRFKRLDQFVSLNGKATQGRTPFSMQRFYIPKLNNYESCAVYLDSDMLVFSNIGELLDCRDTSAALSSAPAPPGSGRRSQYSMMVIDCAKARWEPDEIVSLAQDSYSGAMFDFEFEESKKTCLPYQWNSLEQFDSDTKLLHFTDMDIQPWISNINPLAPVWMEALFKALEDEYIKFDELVQAVRRGWIRPGILWQVENGERNPLNVPASVRAKDSLFMPPHTVDRFIRYNNAATRGALAFARKIYRFFRRIRNG